MMTDTEKLKELTELVTDMMAKHRHPFTFTEFEMARNKVKLWLRYHQADYTRVVNGAKIQPKMN